MWTVKLDAPILSVDYSLSPEAPFPRAIEEVFYAYCWALKNVKLLGSTGENIVFVGDSAGGNIATACLIRCIEMGVPLPKGILNICSVLNHGLKIIPSRFFSLIDGILPFVFVFHLLKSYGNADHYVLQEIKTEKCQQTISYSVRLDDQGRRELLKKELNFRIIRSHLLSPFETPEEILAQFPPTAFMTSKFDALLDDNVEFAKKLKRLNVKTSLNVAEGLSHGFIYFTAVRFDSNENPKIFH